MDVIKAPDRRMNLKLPWVFLAGSIEMGAAEDWQLQLTKMLKDVSGTIFNPRRDDWDSSWEQSIHNKQFREQVEWELDSMEMCDLVVIYFDPETKSPITLLELGLLAADSAVASEVVCCPEGFWRKGNVDIVCNRYSIPQVDSIANLGKFVRKYVEKYESE